MLCRKCVPRCGPYALGPSVVFSPVIPSSSPTAGLGLPVDIKGKGKGRTIPVLGDVAPVSPKVATINIVSDIGITSTESLKVPRKL